MLKGNKGDWSELYAFCYIMKSGILNTADESLNPSNYPIYPVIKVIRGEENTIEYFPGNPARVYQNDVLVKEIDNSDFEKAFNILYKEIPQGYRAFEIPELNDFFGAILVDKVKADSLHKKDIQIQIHDPITGFEPISGFSIKSYLGADPTLINASGATNFVYRINNCNDSIMSLVNSINSRTKIIDRMNALIDSSCTFAFSKLTSPQFEVNLQFVDSLMPQILGHALLISFKDFIKPVDDVIEKLKEDNPLHFSNKKMYEYKIKKLLCACALGLLPNVEWEGLEEASGGFIVVKRDGQVVCYHIYNRSDFEDYLFKYTCFESGSTSKHNYASVYKVDDCFFINLNLQIRFK